MKIRRDPTFVLSLFLVSVVFISPVDAEQSCDKNITIVKKYMIEKELYKKGQMK
jgi:hypothetical protein